MRLIDSHCHLDLAAFDSDRTTVVQSAAASDVSDIIIPAVEAGTWAELAQLVLQAAYEATICAAIINQSNKLFLTLLGGGAFGNEDAWIIGAIERAVIRYREHDLDIAIVSHSRSATGRALAIESSSGTLPGRL